VPESASGHIAYMRKISDIMVIIPDGWTNKIVVAVTVANKWYSCRCCCFTLVVVVVFLLAFL